jgi:hypothetical protein
MLSIAILAVMLSVVMLSYFAECFNAKCRYD